MSNEFTEVNAELEGLAAEGLAPEELPSLTDFADEPGGALPAGWYKAEVIEGYATRKGTQFETGDAISKQGDSHNLRICLKVTPIKGDPRNIQTSFNYRASDFTKERLEFIKEQREIFKGVRGAWSDRDAQRSSLAVAFLGQFEKALGFRLTMRGGAILSGAFVGQKLDVRLKVDDKGYNEVTAYAKAGDFTGKSK